MLRPTRKPARKTQAAASSHTGQTGAAVRGGRSRRVIHRQRPRRYTSGGYASGALQKTSPSLNSRSEIEKERSASRSRLRSESGRRRSASPTKKSAQKPSHSHSPLMVLPPKAPAPPRAIDQ